MKTSRLCSRCKFDTFCFYRAEVTHLYNLIQVYIEPLSSVQDGTLNLDVKCAHFLPVTNSSMMYCEGQYD